MRVARGNRRHGTATRPGLEFPEKPENLKNHQRQQKHPSTANHWYTPLRNEWIYVTIPPMASSTRSPRTTADPASDAPFHSGDELLAVTGTRRCLFGENHQIKGICEIVRKVARSRGPVLIRGESGTGKEVLAAAIHGQSPRSAGPFLAVNAGAIPAELFESELFGAIKGAFTGADRDRRGRFDEADGGTLFLDEVGDMPLLQQVKLLRVLQSGEIHPVGAPRPHRVDTRVVTATNRNLESMVREGTFREDLYFRLNLFVITIPPLRERREDILPLARILAGRFAGEQGLGEPVFTADAEKLLTTYSWPGNIRELENALHYAVTMAEGDRLMPWHLPDAVRSGRSPFQALAGSEASASVQDSATLPGPAMANGQPHPPQAPLASSPTPDLSLPLAEVEKRHILAVYDAHSQNKTHAARALGISVRSLQLKLAAWGVSGK